MAKAVIDDVVAATVKAQGAMLSATALINGFSDKLKQAIADALENGATAEELAPLSDLDDQLNASSDELAAAVAANP